MILGYESRYSGGAIGARALAAFGDVLTERPGLPLIKAWRRANESVRPKQPWAALAAVAGENLNIRDWRRNHLPPLANAETLLHFNAAHPKGREARLEDERYAVRWVTDRGTEVTMENNQPGSDEVGLFAGRRARIVIRAKQEARKFKQGQHLQLFIYRYRSSKNIDLGDWFEFDSADLKPHPNTGVPVVVPEVGRVDPAVRSLATTDSLRIIVPQDGMRVELGLKVKPAAQLPDLRDGPSGTFGRFLLDLVHNPLLVDDPILGRPHIVPKEDGGNTFEAAAGALLRG